MLSQSSRCVVRLLALFGTDDGIEVRVDRDRRNFQFVCFVLRQVVTHDAFRMREAVKYAYQDSAVRKINVRTMHNIQQSPRFLFWHFLSGVCVFGWVRMN